MSNLETPREDKGSPSPARFSFKKKRNKKQNKTKKIQKLSQHGQEGWDQNGGNLGIFHGEQKSLPGVQQHHGAVEEPGPVRAVGLSFWHPDAWAYMFTEY